MADDLRDVAPGQRFNIPAGRHNAWNAAARSVLGKSGMSGADGITSRDPDVIRVKNTTGSGVGQYGILGIDGILFTPADNLDGFKSQPVLLGIAPTTAQRGKFIILLEPIAAGQIGRGLISGQCVVQVNVVTSSDGWADVKNTDVTQLQSGPSGAAQILYAESGTGTKWALVRLGGGRAVGTFPVIVKQNGGANGDATTIATYAYDLYDPADTSYVTKLNLSGALVPLNSRARNNVGIITRVSDGTLCTAMYGADGMIVLWDCPETRGATVCVTP